MKSFVFCSIMVVAIRVAFCQENTNARVLRVMLETNSVFWTIYIQEDNKTNVFREKSITNVVSSQNLHQGDIMIIWNKPERRSGPKAGEWDWLYNYCRSNNVGTYITCRCPTNEFFQTPIYHWATAFTDQRN